MKREGVIKLTINKPKFSRVCVCGRCRLPVRSEPIPGAAVHWLVTRGSVGCCHGNGAPGKFMCVGGGRAVLVPPPTAAC